MIGSIVLNNEIGAPSVLPPATQAATEAVSETIAASIAYAASGTSPKPDPLSEVLTLLKPESYASGGFTVPGDLAIYFPQHTGIKCYAMLAGECWLVVEGVPEPMLLKTGDCFLLPRGLPFRLATDLTLEPVHYTVARKRMGLSNDPPDLSGKTRYIAGGFFGLADSPARMLLQSLPPVVALQRESDKDAMRWCLERMRNELRHPQPGGSLITQQIAYMMLIQALRLHLLDATGEGPGWLAGLADKQMSVAITSMHGEPGRDWTLETLAAQVGMSRSVFALRFRQVVGTTPMEYLTRWRMMLAADRLKTTSDGLASIAQSLGYESESAFGKAFRRVMGCSPRQFGRGTA